MKPTTSSEFLAFLVEYFASKKDHKSAQAIGSQGLGFSFQSAGIDSLAMMELIMAIEDHHDVNIPVSQLPEIRTAAELFGLVCRLCDVEPEYDGLAVV